jgi:5'-3' exonuclease, N-terminal resolvase-like domain
MLYLIDASIFIFRAYHTVPNSLTDRDGNPVNALHGFARFIGDLIERVGPTHIAVAFDATLVTSFRCFPNTRRIASPRPQISSGSSRSASRRAMRLVLRPSSALTSRRTTFSAH